MSVGNKIQEARKAKKLTQAQLGKLIGVSGSMIGQYENGLRNPKFETISKISKALEVSTSYFLGLSIDDNSSIDAAQQMYSDFIKGQRISEALEIILKTLYGEPRKISVQGQHANSAIIVYGDDDNSIYIEEGVFLAIRSAIEGVVTSIVNTLGETIDEAVQKEKALLNSEATEDIMSIPKNSKTSGSMNRPDAPTSAEDEKPD